MNRTYFDMTAAAISEVAKVSYTDIKAEMILSQIAINLAQIADELAAMRKGSKGLPDPSVEIAHVEYSEAECGREK